MLFCNIWWAEGVFKREKPMHPETKILQKFDNATKNINSNTKSNPFLGIAERATATKLKSRNGRINTRISLKKVLIVKKKRTVSCEMFLWKIEHNKIANNNCMNELE